MSTLLVHLHVTTTDSEENRLQVAHAEGPEAYSREAVSIAESHLLDHSFEVVDAEEID